MKRISGRRVLRVTLSLTIGFVFLSNVGSAQSWTGEGDDNLWDNPDNWDTFTVPTVADQTRINAPGAEDNPPLIEDGIDAEVGVLISDALIDITEGMLVLEGDEVFKVEELIDRGQIVAYGGDGTVEYDFDGVSTIVTACPPPTPSGWMFAGDFNADGSLNVSDPVALLNNLFGGGEPPPCGDMIKVGHPSNVAFLDCNGDNRINLADPICTLNFLFLGGPPPAAGVDCLPIPECPSVCQG